jgi:O-antigen/teichoic acid export membrane protein
MTLTDIHQAVSRGIVLRVGARAKEWLAGEHALTQRMAGNAFAIRIASAGIIFLSQIVLARWMGEYEFGTYVYVWTWLMLVGELVHLGLPLTAQRFVPEYRQSGSLDQLRGYLAGSCWITFLSGTAAAAFGAIILYAIRPWLDSAAILPLYFACAALPFYALTFMLDGLARCYNWINLALVPAFVLRPLLLIGIIAALHITGQAVDAATVAAVLAGVTCLTVLIQLGQLQRRFRTVIPPGPKRYAVRQWLHTSLPTLLVWGMYTLLMSSDVLVLTQFRTADEVAHYYAAAKLLALVSIIQYAVAAAAAHRFTAYQVAGDRDGLGAFATETVRWVFWPSLAVTLLIVALGHYLLMLFGAGFVAGYPFMAILAVGLLARASIGPTERLLNMLGEQRLCAWAYATAFAVNLVGAFLLAPRFGGIGVACATSAAFVVESTLLFVIARRRLRLHMFIWKFGLP